MFRRRAASLCRPAFQHACVRSRRPREAAAKRSIKLKARAIAFRFDCASSRRPLTRRREAARTYMRFPAAAIVPQQFQECAGGRAEYHASKQVGNRRVRIMPAGASVQ